jgi:hypothetical protein
MEREQFWDKKPASDNQVWVRHAVKQPFKQKRKTPRKTEIRSIQQSKRK